VDDEVRRTCDVGTRPGHDSLADLARQRRVLRGVASGYVAQGVAVVTAFVLTPLVLHHVGRTHFGLWMLVAALVSYGSLLDLGISSAVIKYVAEYRANGRSDAARVLIATALWVYGLLGLLVVLLSVALAPLVPVLFDVPDGDRALATWLTIVAGVGIGIGIPFSTPRAVLRGVHRFDLANAAALAATLLTAAGTVAMILLDRGILAIVAVSVVVTVVLQPVSVWFVRRAAPDVAYGWRGARRDAVGTIVGLGSSVSVMQIAGQLLGRSGPVIVGLSLPVAAVTPYALAQRLAQATYMSISELPKLLMPLSTEVHARRDRDQLRGVFIASSRITLAVGTATAATVAVLGGELLEAWVGAEYARYAPVVALLALTVITDALNLPAVSVILGTGRHRPLAAIAIGAGLLNVALALAFVRPWGLTGVAAATVVARVCALLVQTPYAARSLGLGLGEILRRTIVPVLAPAVALVAVAELLARSLEPDTFLELIPVAAVAVATFVVLYLAFGASEGERALYRGAARRLRRGQRDASSSTAGS
jgi:O-antigen/teichoic acid export membrane protein